MELSMKYYKTTSSPLGNITLQCTDIGITGAWFETHTTQPDDLGKRNEEHPHLILAAKQLKQYFAGERTHFEIPFDIAGTAFQATVWKALTTIPYGETWSYKQLANAIDNPAAIRAVGTANGKNPISVFIPCHRVIASDGKLAGYAGGIERKKFLLDLESSHR
jgi:methylated-DNA-[protein]-cysteine S-methyltransferase